MFKHILVPLDGSAMSEAALPVAALVAARTGATLMLIHVVEKNAPSAVHSDRHLVTADEATAYLEALTKRPPLAGLAVATHVHTAEVRDVARSITEHTDELAPDVVIMTTHGTGGARRLFSGAIAQQVVGHGLTPVLLVRPPDEGAADGHASGQAAARPWTSILAPIDGDPSHEKSLPIAADLAVAFGCRLHLLMVTHTSASLAGTDHATETFLPGATRIKLEMESAAALEYVEARARELSARGIETGAEASRGDPSEAIIKAARKLGPDLVVMATHGRAGAGAFFEGSVAARVVARARASLLLVPVKDQTPTVNHHERFNALMQGEPVDRLPVYFFGTWAETKLLWRAQGCPGIAEPFDDAGPQLSEMDPDWEDGMWSCHGLANTAPIGDREPQVVECGEGWVLRRDELGTLLRESTIGASIPQIVEPALSPDRASWSRFRAFLDPADPRRRPADAARIGAEVARRDKLLAFMGGSLFGWLRNWMGLEAISFLQYDDPLLLEEMIDHLADLFMELLGPVCAAVPFDLVYFFEDCCGAAGPLFSPAFYRRVLAPRYARLLDFYRSRGVRWSLIDSDGSVEALAPCWIESGFDILFPLEAGKWGATPAALRAKLGAHVRIMGAVNKNVLSRGADSVRAHLESLRPEVDRGGFLPLPDHRIPPAVSYEQFRGYLRIFNEVFAR